FAGNSSGTCGVCGMSPTVTFDRTRVWGQGPAALAHRLDALGNDHPKPTITDFAIMNGIFGVIRDVQSKATDRKARRSDVEKGIRALFPRSSKYARKDLLEAMAWCSIL